MDHDKIIIDLQLKYGEWLEMAGDKSSALMIHILASLLIKEREENSFLKKRLEYAIKSHTAD